MRFRRPNNKENYVVREATLEDSEFLSDLNLDYIENYQTIQVPMSPNKYRLAIGSGLVNNEKILIAEDSDGAFLGYIEQKRPHPYQAFVSYPYVEIYHPDRERIQKMLIKHAISSLKRSGVRYIGINISKNIPDSIKLFESFGFIEPTSIHQLWEGIIEPIMDLDIEPYEIREVRQDDLDVTYNWIKSQNDKKSPFYLSKGNYASMLMSPSSFRENWAIATLDERPIALIAAMIDPNTNSAQIFGPYNDEGYVQVRIPLMNELFVHLRMKGLQRATIFRKNEFYNDEELFRTFNFEKIEDIVNMLKIL